jgi:hypothetical protein
MSGGEAASSELLGPRSGLVMFIASFGRAGAEQGLAVVAAEQEDEPVQVLAQLADVVCGVADELFQGGAEAAGIAGQPLAEELQQLGERSMTLKRQGFARLAPSRNHGKIDVGINAHKHG